MVKTKHQITKLHSVLGKVKLNRTLRKIGDTTAFETCCLMSNGPTPHTPILFLFVWCCVYDLLIQTFKYI